MFAANKLLAAAQEAVRKQEELVALRWWKVPLPTSPPVVRKEIREMSRAEQGRYANAM